MKKTIMLQILLLLIIGYPTFSLASPFYSFSASKIGGEKISFEQFRGKVVLVVNTASQCGFTPQLAELEELYQQYKEKGFIVLAFPSNDFKQDPKENEQIQKFATENYGVTFPLFEKVKVTGKDKHPLYHFLTKEKSGLLTSEVSWNFEKFLIDRSGKVVERFNSMTSPKTTIRKHIEKLL